MPVPPWEAVAGIVVGRQTGLNGVTVTTAGCRDKEGLDLRKARLGQGGAHSRLFWGLCASSPETSMLSLKPSSAPMCSTLKKHQRPMSQSQSPQLGLYSEYLRLPGICSGQEETEAGPLSASPDLLKRSLLRPSSWVS